MKSISSLCVAVSAALAFVTAAPAAIIEYDVTNVTGATWRYDYTVTNDSLPTSIDEFTVFFSQSLYQDISFPLAPLGWDPLSIQPDPSLPDDGFYDALALGPGLSPGGTLGGFSVMFTWLGAGTPGTQLFDVVDPITFQTIESGVTRGRVMEPPMAVSEPATLALLGAGLFLLIGGSRRGHSGRVLNR